MPGTCFSVISTGRNPWAIASTNLEFNDCKYSTVTTASERLKPLTTEMGFNEVEIILHATAIAMH